MIRAAILLFDTRMIRRPLLVVLLCLAQSLATVAQTTFIIRGQDFFYDPDTLFMQPGDSIRYQPQGSHDMVSVDSVYWATGQPLSNGFFQTALGVETTFVVESAGTYYFICSPHGFAGMRGVLFVSDTLSTGTVHQQHTELRIRPVPAADRLVIDNPPTAAHSVAIVDMAGACVTTAFRSLGTAIEIDVPDLVPGVYLVLIRDRSGVLIQRANVIIGIR